MVAYRTAARLFPGCHLCPLFIGVCVARVLPPHPVSSACTACTACAACAACTACSQLLGTRPVLLHFNSVLLQLHRAHPHQGWRRVVWQAWSAAGRTSWRTRPSTSTCPKRSARTIRWSTMRLGCCTTVTRSEHSRRCSFRRVCVRRFAADLCTRLYFAAELLLPPGCACPPARPPKAVRAPADRGAHLSAVPGWCGLCSYPRARESFMHVLSLCNDAMEAWEPTIFNLGHVCRKLRSSPPQPLLHHGNASSGDLTWPGLLALCLLAVAWRCVVPSCFRSPGLQFGTPPAGATR